MSKTFRFLLVLLFILITVSVVFSSSITTIKAERIAKKFLQMRMLGPEGGVYTGSRMSKIFLIQSYNPSEFSASGYMSENISLLMNYAAFSGDRELFDRQLNFLLKSLQSPYGVFSWKISHDGAQYSESSSSGDDLRTISALLAAYRKWNRKSYLKYALQIADAVRKNEVENNELREYFSWRKLGEPEKAQKVKLAWLDVPTMDELSEYDSSWTSIADRAFETLKGGKLPTGLFYGGYDYTSSSYQNETQPTYQQLYCGICITGRDYESAHKMLEFFKTAFALDNTIYDEYSAKDGGVSAKLQSPRTYAVAARLAYRVGDIAFGVQMIAKLRAYQELNPASPLYGSFHDEGLMAADNIEALLALYEHNSRGR